VDVHVALFSDIILLMQPHEGRLVLRSQYVVVVAGKETIHHGPIIKLNELIVQPYAAGMYTQPQPLVLCLMGKLFSK